MRQNFRTLFDEVPRKLGINVLEKSLACWRIELFDFLNRCRDLGHQTFFERRILGIVEQTSLHEMPTQTHDRITQGPHVDFTLRSITSRIVAR